MSLTAAQIAELTGGRLTGPPQLSIDSMQTLELARTGQLTFIGDDRYAARWPNSQASAALLRSGIELPHDDSANGRAVIEVADVDLATATVLEALAPAPVSPPPGIHPAAYVDDTAEVADSARVGPGCVIGPRVSIAANVVLHANVTVLDDCRIGESTVIWPGVVLRERTILGQRCIIHPNATLGADGFGYRPAPVGSDGPPIVKIPQIGHVEIGNDVEIGSGTCIDRGKFAATVIGDATKIDNLVQIGHNCRIGRCVIIVGSCGISGSVTIGDGAIIGAGVGIADHLAIGPGARLAARSGVMSDVPAGETWGGEPAQPIQDAKRMHIALRSLHEMVREWKKAKRGASRDDAKG